MLIIDLYGAPGAGKSTTSACLFSILKDRGEKVSLISESATDLIESGQDYMLKDPEYQSYVISLQFKKIKDQQRLGTEYLITDSPILYQLSFVENTHVHEPLKNLFTPLMSQYETFNVLILRNKVYSNYKRITSDKESRAIQQKLLSEREYQVSIQGRVAEVPKIVSALDKFIFDKDL